MASPMAHSRAGRVCFRSRLVFRAARIAAAKRIAYFSAAEKQHNLVPGGGNRTERLPVHFKWLAAA